MKKGFTMIELIFVIVILGILASVAIPRLAATREDAEISATVANLRTLLSDVNSYYAVKGSFNGAGSTVANWKDITNVPLQKNNNGAIVATDKANTEVSIAVGGKNCIGVKLVDKTTGATTTPAHIEITANSTNKNNGVCKQVVGSEPLKAYFTSTVNGKTANNNGTGYIAIGSSTSVYGKK